MGPVYLTLVIHVTPHNHTLSCSTFIDALETHACKTARTCGRQSRMLRCVDKPHPPRGIYAFVHAHAHALEPQHMNCRTCPTRVQVRRMALRDLSRTPPPPSRRRGASAGGQCTINNKVDFKPNLVRGCSWSYGLRAVEAFLEENNFRGILRAHSVQVLYCIRFISRYEVFTWCSRVNCGFPLSWVCVHASSTYSYPFGEKRKRAITTSYAVFSLLPGVLFPFIFSIP